MSSNAKESAIDLKQSYFLNSSAELSVQDVETQKFISYNDTLHLGFQSGDIWLKLEIPVTDESIKKNQEERVLILSPFILERIDLFEKIGQVWLVQYGGSMASVSNRICPYGMHCFRLNETDLSKEIILFIRLKHTGYITIKSEITTLSALAKLTSNHTESITFSQSIAISLFCISLVLVALVRTPFVITYSALQFIIYLYIIFASGIIFKYIAFLPAEHYSLINYEFINLRVLLSMLLIYTIMREYIQNTLYKIISLSLISLLVFNFAVIATDSVKTGIYTYVAVLALFMPIQFYGLSKRKKMPASIFWLLLASLLTLTSIIAYGYFNIFTESEVLTARGAEFIFYTNYRMNGVAFGVVVFLILIIKHYEMTILNLIRDKDLQLAHETFRINNEKLEERQTLIDVLTHELKNPLSTLKFATHALKQAVSINEKNVQRSNRINSSLQRIDQLINHVANSNKIDRYQIANVPDRIHANSLVMQVIEDQLQDSQTIEERFHMDIDDSAVFCSNLKLLSLSIENLISNALKYAKPQTLINVKVKTNVSFLDFSITNYFPPEAMPDADKLFQRYYRHDIFQPMPGMGLGLTLVNDAAQKIGSEVKFFLEDNRITFTLSVPICKT